MYLRRLNVSFDLVCDNTPILGYPLSVLYIFRYSACGNIHQYTNYIHIGLMCVFARSRMFDDGHLLPKGLGITLYRSGYSMFDVPLGKYYVRPLSMEYPIGTHIPIWQNLSGFIVSKKKYVPQKVKRVF